MTPVTKSRNVKRYVVAWQQHRALGDAFAAAKVRLALVRGTLTGSQLAEAERILNDGALLAQVKVPMVRVK